jgi:hypothetical protein
VKATTEQIVSALRVLSVEMHSEDGVANAVVAEAADRLTLMANLVARHVEETKDDIQQMAGASDTLIKATAKIQSLRDRIKRLEEWKQSALEVEREWDANAVATMLGGKLGESHRKVIQREVPKLLTRIKRLEEALEGSLKWIVDLANSGDAGFWNPEEQSVIIAARKALQAKEAKP